MMLKAYWLKKTKQIIVVGSGIAGICAALSSADSGNNVIIIEKSSCLGGNLVRTNVGTICGSYLRSKTDNPILVGNEFTQSLILEFKKILNLDAPINYHNGLYVIPYQWDVLQDFFEKKINSNPSIKIIYDTAVVGFETESNSITQIITSNENLGKIKCDSVVDCSGISNVSSALNHQLIKANNYQAASQIFRVSGVDRHGEFSINMAIKKFLLNYIKQSNLSLSHNSISVVPGSIRENSIDLKLTLPDLIDDNIDVDQLSKNASMYIDEVFYQMTKKIDCFKGSQIENVFPDLGVRVMSRPKAREVLTKNDVLNCVKAVNGVAIGTWPIEYWNSKGELEMTYLPEEEYFLISANSLISGEFNNLFFAGKNISASEEGVASARVIGTCIQTGYAAGKLASAYGIENNIVSDLRSALKIADEYI